MSTQRYYFDLFSYHLINRHGGVGGGGVIAGRVHWTVVFSENIFELSLVKALALSKIIFELSLVLYELNNRGFLSWTFHSKKIVDSVREMMEGNI